MQLGSVYCQVAAKLSIRKKCQPNKLNAQGINETTECKTAAKKTQKPKTEKHWVQYLKQNTTYPLEPKTDREHTFNVMMFHYVAKQPLQTT